MADEPDDKTPSQKFDEEIREKAREALESMSPEELAEALRRRRQERKGRELQEVSLADLLRDRARRVRLGGLTEEEMVDQAIAWLQEIWGFERECPYCGTATWSVGSVIEVQLASGETLSPHFPVMCVKCGNTVFINAILAGIVPEPDTEPEQ